MVDVDDDSIKIRECGLNIIELSKELDTLINEIFKRISNMPNTQEWVGLSANEFIKLANIDKIQYLDLKDCIFKRGLYLVNYADNIEKEVLGLKR